MTETQRTNNTEVHRLGVDYVASRLAEGGLITTESKDGIVSLTLGSGKTILVRAISNDARVPLIHGNIDLLHVDYVIIIVNVAVSPAIYILPVETAKDVAVNAPDKATGRDNYFIDAGVYKRYGQNPIELTGSDEACLNNIVITERVNTTIREAEMHRVKSKRTADAKAEKAAEKKNAEDTAAAVKAEAKAAERAAFRADYERRHNISPKE